MVEVGQRHSKGGLQAHHAAGGVGQGPGLFLSGVGGVVGGDGVNGAVLQSLDNGLHVRLGAQGRVYPCQGALG